MTPCPLDAVIAECCARVLPLSLSLKDAVRHYQQRALHQSVAQAAKSRFYQNHLAPHLCRIQDTEHGFTGDFTSLPFTTAADLAQDWRNFLCVSQDAVARIVTLPTSGTTGAPKRIAFSAADLEQTVAFFSEGMRQLVQAGETVLVLLPGAERPSGVTDLLRQAMLRIGARIVAGHPEATPETLREDIACNPHCIVAAPGQLARLLDAVWQQPVFLRDISQSFPYSPFRMSGILSSAEPLTPDLAHKLATVLNCQVLDHYGLTESGYGCAVECRAHDGYHLRETDLYCEIVDIWTGQPLADGNEGEIVLTTLGREAMPLIRYRTGDVSTMLPGPCRCGSPLRRLAPIRGRLVREAGTVQIRKLPKGVRRASF